MNWTKKKEIENVVNTEKKENLEKFESKEENVMKDEKIEICEDCLKKLREKIKQLKTCPCCKKRVKKLYKVNKDDCSLLFNFINDVNQEEQHNDKTAQQVKVQTVTSDTKVNNSDISNEDIVLEVISSINTLDEIKQGEIISSNENLKQFIVDCLKKKYPDRLNLANEIYSQLQMGA
jgi:hypothetical protein